jgi:hypothetical protein
VKNILRKLIRRAGRPVTDDIVRELTDELSRTFERYKIHSREQLESRMDHLMVLAGVQSSLSLHQLDVLQTLGDAEFQVFSQWGEDGIIEWLVSRLPQIPQSFVEFGVEDYSQANTRFLLANRNWRGLVMDCSLENMNSLSRTDIRWRHDLTAVAAFVEPDNINSLISGNGYAGELGILSIDIDSNDYWIWDAITVADPWIVIVEYNAVFGDLRPISIPYTRGFDRTVAHSSFLYWGASIAAWMEIAGKRGYTLLGTNRAGCNAFFIRNELLPTFEGKIRDRAPRPSLYRESRSPEREFSYLAGETRRNAIADAQVFDVRTGETMRMGDAGEIYSARWKRIMGTK